MDTRYPRRLLTFRQVTRPFLFMTDPQLASSLAKITLRAVRARITRTSHIDQLHRLSAIWEADVIHVMERGRLVDSGD